MAKLIAKLKKKNSKAFPNHDVSSNGKGEGISILYPSPQKRTVFTKE